MQTQQKTPGRALLALAAVLSMFLAGATGAAGLALTTPEAPEPAADAAPGTRGAVLTSARSGDGATYTLRSANEPENGDIHGTTIGGRGASFAFQFYNATVPVYNAQEGGDNLVGYISCGSSCGKRAVLATATTTEGIVPCTDSARIVPNQGFQSLAECDRAKPESEQRWALFASSDAPANAGDYARAAALGGELIHVPLIVGTVAFVYNLAPQCNAGLDLHPLEVARMFRPVSGQSGHSGITFWDDPALRTGGRNTCLGAVGHVPIQPVIRCDGSGTTFAWSDFLARAPGVGAPWVASELIGNIVENEYCGPQNAGVSQCVMGVIANTQCPAGSAYGRMGYVELTQALIDDLDVADIRNRDDTAFVTPSAESGEAAARNADLPESHEVWTQVTIVDQPGIDSYPAATFTYLLTYANPWNVKRPAGETGQANFIDRDGSGPLTGEHSCLQFGALRKFVTWAVTEGQNHIPAGYSGIGQTASDITIRGVNRMACGEETEESIADVRSQGFPVPGMRIGLVAAGENCPADLPLSLCADQTVFVPLGRVATRDVAPLDVVVDVPALGIGLGLNGQWVRVAGAITVVPNTTCLGAAGLQGGLPACELVLVDNIPVGYISGAMKPYVTPGTGSIVGQVIDNLVVVHDF